MSAHPPRAAFPLMIAAMGVVFGDIGTSPLYTLKTCFALVGAQPDLPSVLGICSLLFWALVWVVCIKYVTFIMRVTHQGEGGDLALLGLASQAAGVKMLRAVGLTLVVIVAASMLLGDGIITPAISVLSAIEGIGVASAAAQPYVVPLSLIVIVALFAVQSRGTERVGGIFGPVMLVWFVTLGVLGAVAIARNPHVFLALNPLYALRFVAAHGILGFTILGGVVLAITGVEALYADLSHFGRGPIVSGWFSFVFPALVLNYLGQGALLLSNPQALANPFYALAPSWLLIPMVVLSTLATVIASQALISGTFTVVEQAIALNLAPRVLVTHTSESHKGQVYVPSMNRALALGCAILIVGFRSSDRLAAAYGLAVSCTMFCTSISYYVVITRALGWNRALATVLVACFWIVDGSFVAASLPKFLQGGWIPFSISATLFLISTTWLEGRRCLAQALTSQQTPLEEVARQLPEGVPEQRTMVFLTNDPRGVPFLARHRWIRERAREERLVVLNIAPAPTPKLEHTERVTIERFSQRLIRVIARFGYMEPPRIEPILQACAASGLELDKDDTSFFYADPKIERAPDGMPSWRRELFATLQRNARPLPDDLRIQAERRVELGVTVAI
ncbi:MAG: KUP/HAK/KT family potassium transporter [Candidatus Eremiobacteraeota bacterium]|nr:KUP/HAK/KT family potassium transporter [Candidatus Eremiobacteraeota bacterium]